MAQPSARTRSARRSVRVVAGIAAVGLGATAIVAAGGGTAGAATIKAQSVGRFLDGSAGGNPIQGLVDLKDARATAPGTTSAQNPLDVKAFNALNIPLTDAISIPTNPAVDAGVVNQVATANINGKSLGAAGAVADDGGASLGDDNDGEPAVATVKLNAASAAGAVKVPGLPTGLPGLPTGGLPDLPGADGATLDALGGVTANLGAVFSRVSTAKGGEVQTPSSGITNVSLTIGSPALGALLQQVKGVLANGDLGDLPITLPGSGLPTIPGLPAAGDSLSLKALLALLGEQLPDGCALTDASFDDDIDLKNGVVIDVQNAEIRVNVQQLIAKVLGKDISNLDTSNFDLVSFLVENLPDILSKGLSGFVSGITDELADQFENCADADALPAGLGTLLTTVVDQLKAGQTQIINAINGISDQLSSAGASGLNQLADGLTNLIDIGLNVQSGPGIEPQEKTYDYQSDLDATPNQATDVVDGQTLVRAIEINILDADAIPGADNAPDGINVALANSAVGPSDVTPADSTSTPVDSPTVIAGSDIPTGIPAGLAGSVTTGGSPLLPIIAVLMLLAVSGAAFWHLRTQRDMGGTGGSHRR